MRLLTRYKWPDDIPSACPNCGFEMTLHLNLTVGKGKVGRFFEKLAYRGAIPWMILFTIWFLSGEGFWVGRQPGYALIIMYILPSVLLALVSACCPISRRVRCWDCGSSRDFPALAKKD